MPERFEIKKTDLFFNKCDCGRTKGMGHFVEVKEMSKEKDGKDVFLSFCKCGVVFLAIPPDMEEKLFE
mgnify:CR=1 FL=1